MTLQPIQQLLPANPLMAKQWADVSQDFSQDQYLEKDKFQNPNTQPENPVNSETQTNTINQQQVIDDTTVFSPENNNQFAISKNNMKRFLFMPSDQIESAMRQAEQDQDPGLRICAIESCHVDARGAKRIAQMEGGKFRDKPYDDQTGDYITQYKKGATIGWGHLITGRAEFEKYKNGITEPEAIRLKQVDSKKAEKKVKNHIKVPVTQDMYNALVSRAFNGGDGAFTAKSNGSKFITDYINSGRKLNFGDPKDKDTQLFITAYQRLDISQRNYMRGLEFRRMKELDMMRHDYKEYSIKTYVSRQLYGPSKNPLWKIKFK